MLHIVTTPYYDTLAPGPYQIPHDEIPTGSRVSYHSSRGGLLGRNNTSGNINLDPYGVIIEEDGCYEVSMEFKGCQAKDTSAGKKLRISWHKNTYATSGKLTHLTVGAPELSNSCYTDNKKRSLTLLKGDKIITKVELNDARAKLVRAGTEVKYISSACNF